MACSENGFRLGSLLTSDLNSKTHALPTHVYSVKPPHRKRRAVSGVSLQTQAVPPVNDMISASLCAQTAGTSILLLLLVLVLAFGLVGLSSRRCRWGLRRSCT